MTRADLRFLGLVCVIGLAASAAVGAGAFVLYESAGTALTAAVGTAIECAAVIGIGMTIHVRHEKRQADRRARMQKRYPETIPQDPWKPDSWDLEFDPEVRRTPPS